MSEVLYSSSSTLHRALESKGTRWLPRIEFGPGMRPTSNAISGDRYVRRGLFTALLCLLTSGEVPAVDLDAKLVGNWPGFIRGGAMGVAVSGSYAYLATGGAGLVVLDITNLTNILRVGGCHTGGNARNVAVSGSLACVAADDAG